MHNNFDGLINEIFNAVADQEITPEVIQNASPFEIDRLSIAAQTQDKHLFVTLLEAENQKQRRPDEPTLLMSAVMAGRADVVRALIDAGADVNAKMELFFTFTALGFALEEGNPEIVQFLLDAGADVNSYDVEGKTALMTAIECRNFEVAQQLIDAGADPNALMNCVACDIPEMTIVCDSALHLAIEWRDLDAIAFLLQAGADPNLPNSEGIIARDLAQQKGLSGLFS
jgi:hypothetical protein